MFKKTRVKIILSIMAVIIVILLGTMAIIYGTSYAQMSADNQQMLKLYARQYSLKHTGDSNRSKEEEEKENVRPKEPEKMSHNVPPPEKKHKFDVSTFYAVAISGDGTVLQVDNEAGTMYSDATLTEYAQKIISGTSKKGVKGSLAYYKSEKKDYTLVVFMDNVVMQGGMVMLFRNTMIFGCFSIVAVFIAAIFLARRIVSPLEESYQKQKQFISDAGHELKTPISVVGASAELLEKEIGDNQWLSNIQYENERMASLVKQLLELTKTENVALQLERVDFSRLTAGEILPFESIAFEHGLQLESQITEGIYVNGDSGRLKQLVSILIDNAICHSENCNVVNITLQAEHNYAKLSVVNHGKEIPVEQQKQIFERFYRIDSARSGDDRHFGLGLAIAGAITNSHNGEITVSCEKGEIEFSVQLPIKK